MRKHLFLFIAILSFCACNGNHESTPRMEADKIVVYDTIMPEGIFTYDLPCKIEYINSELKGKAILVFWLHGGVMDRGAHSLLNKGNNHIDERRNTGYNAISTHLRLNSIKAVYIAPICHKAANPNCVRWIDCAGEIKHIIDDYVSKGFVDPDRIFIAGSSDGGTGTWDIVEKYGDWFAAAIPMSCGRPRRTSTIVYFSSTSREGNLQGAVDILNAQGCNIKYQYYPNEKHGGDEKFSCDNDHLTKVFKHKKGE